MTAVYQIADAEDSRALSEYLAQSGQLLLPMVELIESAQVAVEEFMDVLGPAALEAVLELSAQQVAGTRHQGWPGGEVPIPAYEAMQDDTSLQAKLSDILMSGVSTRKYERVILAMAKSCGISKSSVSREFKEASAEKLQELAEQRFDELDLLVIYIDGLRFGDHHVIVALGVDADGYKHILGLREGATENAVVVNDLLANVVTRGVDPARSRLLVIDGSKALQAGLDAVFGTKHPVQRCRNHKVENVMGYLPDELNDQVQAVMKAAYRLPADEGMVRLTRQANWLQQEYPLAAASLREGLEELFTINRLGLPPTLRRCLAATNIVESPSAGVRLRTRRVTRWQDGAMVLRWAATAFLATEQQFRRLMGYRDLWTLKAVLDDDLTEKESVA